MQIDHLLFKLINQEWTSPWLTGFFSHLTDLHKTPLFKITVIPLVLFFLLKRHSWKRATLCLICMTLSLAAPDFAGQQIKQSVQRPRPLAHPELKAIVRAPASGYSFISTHAASSFGLASFCALVFPASGLWLFALSFLIGYSRVYCGVHFPSDVVAGALLGGLCGWIIAKLYFHFARTRLFDRDRSTP